MPQRLINMLQSDTLDAVGYAFTGISISSAVAEMMGELELSEYARLIMFIGSALFALFKAYDAFLDVRAKRIDHKLKRETLKKLIDENKHR